MTQFLHGKIVACSGYGKNPKHVEMRLLKIINFFRSSCSKMFIKEVFLRTSLHSEENTYTGVSI